MAASADKIFTKGVRKLTRRGSTSWVHPAPHTNDPHLVNRIMSPKSRNSSAKKSTSPLGYVPETNIVDPVLGRRSPHTDFIVKGNQPFHCPVRIYPINGSFLRSDDDAGIVTVSHDKKRIYCPKIDMKEIATFEFDDVSDATVTTSEFFERSAMPSIDSVWGGKDAMIVLCGMQQGIDDMVEGELGTGDNASGLIHLAAANLFARRQQFIEANPSAYKVRMSWYEVRGGKIVDLLAAAAATSGNNPNKGAEPPVFTEEKGRGITVSDLVEVEVGCAEDVRQVVFGVRSRLKRRKRHTHAVLSLTVATANGTLSIASMGAIRSREGKYTGWVTELARTLENLRAKLTKSRVPKTEFRSDAMLLLRDSLIRRNTFTFIPCITGDLDDARDTLDALQLGSRLREYCSSTNSAKLKLSSPSLKANKSQSEKRAPGSSKRKPPRPTSGTPNLRSPRGAPKSGTSPFSPSTTGNRALGRNGFRSPSNVPLSSATSRRKRSTPRRPVSTQPSPSLESLANSPLHHDFVGTQPVDGDEDLPSIAAILDTVGEHHGAEARRWLKGAISSLEKSKAETAFLAEELENVQAQNEKTAGSTSDSQRKIQVLKKKLREKVNEVKEYELYKDVMESAVSKQSREMKTLEDDRDRAHARLKKELGATKKQLASTKQKLGFLAAKGKADKKEVAVSTQRLNEQLQVYKRKLNERDDALLVLEDTFRASETENRVLISRLSSANDTISVLENDLENVVRERDMLLAEIKKVEIAFAAADKAPSEDEADAPTESVNARMRGPPIATTRSIKPPPPPPTPAKKAAIPAKKAAFPAKKAAFPAKEVLVNRKTPGSVKTSPVASTTSSRKLQGSQGSKAGLHTVKNAKERINNAKNVVASIRSRRRRGKR
jgi:hypothetical protein